MTNSIERHLLMPLQDFFTLLPDVNPRMAMRIAKDIQLVLEDRYLEANKQLTKVDDVTLVTEVFNGIQVDFERACELRCEQEFDKIRITPRAASLAIELYYAGIWFTKSPKIIESVPITLINYSKKQDSLAEESIQLKKRKAERHAERQRLLENPELISQEMFGYDLLSELFIYQKGLKRKTQQLEVGGILVTKTVTLSSSNSGKGKDFKVIFQWTDATGNNHTICKPSNYQNNRKNDPKRNYGLTNSRRNN